MISKKNPRTRHPVMAFPSAFLEQLRQRLPVSSVVQKHVRLVRKGKLLMGLCPFHGEKTPSFTVNDSRKSYHCFGCGAHGDIIDFVRTYSRFSFVEAVKSLAGIAGLELPPDSSPRDDVTQQNTTLFRVMDAACQWFQDQLNQHEPARQYLTKRGLTQEEIRHYRIGWAPAKGWAEHAHRLGFSQQCLLQAGLIIERSHTSGWIDRFRNRIMFPIMNHQGRILAFGGRTLGDEQPKYMNSPETPLFVKSHTLFQSMVFPPKRPLMVVEGYIDVITCARYGGALAPLGTAVSVHQLDMIWKKNPEPIVCFDGDRAGQQAALKMAIMALPLLKPGYTLRIASLPEDQDPHTWLMHHGNAGYDSLAANALPMSDFLWNSVWRNTSTPESKAAAIEQWNMWVDSIAHLGVRRWYKDFGFTQRRTNTSKMTVRIPLAVSGLEMTQKILVGMLILHPQIIPCVTEDLCRFPQEPSTPWLHVIQYLLLWKGEPMDTALGHILGDDWPHMIEGINQHIPKSTEHLENYWRDIFTAYIMQVNQRLEIKILQKTVLHRPESWEKLQTMTPWEESQ